MAGVPGVARQAAARPVKGVNQSGAEVFYGYDYPLQWSANTGYYAMDTVTIYLIIDSLDRVYLVLTLDQPGTNPGGIFAMDVTSTGLPNEARSRPC